MLKTICKSEITIHIKSSKIIQYFGDLIWSRCIFLIQRVIDTAKEITNHLLSKSTALMQPSFSGLFVTWAYLPHTTLPPDVTNPSSLMFTSMMVPFVMTPWRNKTIQEVFKSNHLTLTKSYGLKAFILKAVDVRAFKWANRQTNNVHRRENLSKCQLMDNENL